MGMLRQLPVLRPLPTVAIEQCSTAGYSIGVKHVALRSRLEMLLNLVLIASVVVEFPARFDAETPQFKADCGLHGHVGAKFPGGRFVPARDAKVYVFYSSAYVDRGLRDKFFTHQPS